MAGEVAAVEQQRELAGEGAVGGGGEHQRQPRDAARRRVGADRGRRRAEPLEAEDRRLRHDADGDAVEPERPGVAPPGGGIGDGRGGANGRRHHGGQPVEHQRGADSPAAAPGEQRADGARPAGEQEQADEGQRGPRNDQAEDQGGKAHLPGRGQRLDREMGEDARRQRQAAGGDRRPDRRRGAQAGPGEGDRGSGGGAEQRPPRRPPEVAAHPRRVAAADERRQDLERQLLGTRGRRRHHQHEGGRGDGVRLEVAEREAPRQHQREKRHDTLSRDGQRRQPRHHTPPPPKPRPEPNVAWGRAVRAAFIPVVWDGTPTGPAPRACRRRGPADDAPRRTLPPGGRRRRGRAWR